MGGLESEVTTKTRRVLLEGAAWNFINIRRTIASQNLHSEASYRFERGVHPAMAERGVRRCLKLMAQYSGGEIAGGLVDTYPLPPDQEPVRLTASQVERLLGIEISAEEIADLLRSLAFDVEMNGSELLVTPPDHRLDIGSGLIGVADLMEEIARIYGYDRIPETMIADALPPVYRDRAQELEERMRDLLADLGLQEIITYRLTTPERERRVLPAAQPPDERPYVEIVNPISTDRVVMRHNLLASVMEIVESNARFRDRIAVFEIGPVYLATEDESLPQEPQKLVIALTGPAVPETWNQDASRMMDFFDLKGIMESFLPALHIDRVAYEPIEHPTFHPGKCAALVQDGARLGLMGEIHPLVRAQYSLPETPLLAAELDLGALLARVPSKFDVESVKSYPPVLEDLAILIEDEIPARRVEDVIRQAGGDLLVEVRLFDLYRGDQIGKGLKSLAYSLVYQAGDRTLTDDEVAKVRSKILARLERELGAKLRA
jgi:phenylalanyl-tRNA synthetase beta chain